ncbi:MAG TPA: Wzz/FepE/Etk N-terminal domain-containing protein [Devosiaceae bacterium]
MSIDQPDDTLNTRADMHAIGSALWRRRLRILLVTALLCAAAYAVLLFVPKAYDSSASLLVGPRDVTFTRAAGDNQSGSGVVDDALITSQIELIQSRSTLLPVIRQEKLDQVPELNGSQRAFPFSLIYRLLGRGPANVGGEDVVLARLKDRLTVIQERNSRIISVIAETGDPVLSARIANAVAHTFVQVRSDLMLQDTADATKWLQGEIETLRQRVATAEKKVADFRVNKDLFVGVNNTSLVDQQLSDIASQITAAQQAKNTAQSRAELIRKLLDSGQPIDGVADVRDSAVIQQLSEQKAQLQGQRALKLATLLPDHPDVRALTAQIGEIDRQIATEGRRVADALESEAKVQANLEQSLRADLARLKVSASQATLDNVTLAELQREATAERDVLETYLQRYRDASGRTDPNSALPDVRVVSDAAPAVAPASPKTKLIVLAVGMLSLALQVGSVVFGEIVSGRALVEGNPASAGDGELAWRPTAGANGRSRDDAEPAAGQGGAAIAKAPESPETDSASRLDELSEAGFELLAAAEAEQGSGVAPDDTFDEPPIVADDLAVDAQDGDDGDVAEETAEQVGAIPTEGADPYADVGGTTVPDALTAEADAKARREAARTSLPSQRISMLGAIEAEPDLDDLEMPESVESAWSDLADLVTRETAPSDTEEQAPAGHAEGADRVAAAEPVPASAGPSKKREPARNVEAAQDPKPGEAESGEDTEAIAALCESMARGEERCVLIVEVGERGSASELAETLVSGTLAAGLSVARVDAGSQKPTAELGLTDLAAGGADFGDVIQPGNRGGLAEVPWGQGRVVDRSSDRPALLVNALGDIYESVVIVAGRLGVGSTLPLFRDLRPFVVISVDNAQVEQVEAAVAGIKKLGFQRIEPIMISAKRNEVA